MGAPASDKGILIASGEIRIKRVRIFPKVFNTAHMRYSQYFNKKLSIAGHLWQGRFYSCILDELHLIAAVRYVERNPVRANIVKKPWEWRWSSALAHVDKDVKPLIKLDDIFKITDIAPDSWKQFIDSKENTSELDIIRTLFCGSGLSINPEGAEFHGHARG